MENHGQKRSAPEDQDILNDVQAVLLDIEGTTTPISFVKDTLFPYIRDNAKKYLECHWESDECKGDVDALLEQASKDKEAEGFKEVLAKEGNEHEAVIQSLLENIEWQMEKDAKNTALKQLQGHMWREAYKAGKVHGQVFDDVVPAVKDWLAQDKKVYIYSSGSVEAQKLLFGHSSEGDLQEMITGYFDTEVGAKVEKESYSKIAKQIGCDASQVLFLTDITAEAAASSEAGMKTYLVKREGNTPISDEDRQKYNMISSFRELCAEVEVPCKKAAEKEEVEGAEAEEESPISVEDDSEGEGDSSPPPEDEGDSSPAEEEKETAENDAQ